MRQSCDKCVDEKSTRTERNMQTIRGVVLVCLVVNPGFIDLVVFVIDLRHIARQSSRQQQENWYFGLHGFHVGVVRVPLCVCRLPHHWLDVLVVLAPFLDQTLYRMEFGLHLECLCLGLDVFVVRMIYALKRTVCGDTVS